MFYPQGTYFLRLHPLGNLYGETAALKPGAAGIDQPARGLLGGLGQKSITCLDEQLDRRF